LGADKEVKTDAGPATRPNIAVRIGAILALERLARQNYDVHCQIMENLCSYIREETSGDDDYAKKHAEKPREDIQIALTLIGRRPERQIAIEPDGLIDLRGAHLVGADLQGARLPTAQLDRAQLHKTILRWAQLNKAQLHKTQLNSANLIDTQLNGADLSMSQLNETNLSFAQLNGTFLYLTQLNKAKLFGAQFNKADLAKAELDKADLNETQLNEVELDKTQLNETNSINKAALRGTSVKNMDFSHVSISREKLHEMFGDASVSLPEGLQPAPAHWPTVVLEWSDFHAEWKKWLADPDGYVFDPTQYGEKYTNQTGA